MKVPTLRAALLTTLLLAFLLSAPLLLLRASGYRIDTQKRRIVQTGAVAVTAFPPGVAVSIDSQTKRGDIFSPSLLFTDLLPGIYTIAVNDEKGSSAPWTKTLTVEARKTFSFPFARLFPQQLPAAFAHFQRTPSGILARSDDFLGWDRRGIFSDNAMNTSIQDVIAGDISGVEQLENNSLLVHFANGSSAFIGQESGKAPNVLPFPQNLHDIHLLTNNQLVGRDDAGTIFFLEVTPQGLALRPIAQHAVALATQATTVAFLDTAGMLWTMRENGSGQQQRTVTPLEKTSGARLFLGRDADFVLAIDGKNTAWLFDHDRDRFMVVADGVSSAELSSDNEKLLLVTQHEVMVYALRERLNQPQRSKGSLETISRLSEPILAARLLAPEAEHVALLTPSGLRIVEFDGRGGRNEMLYPEVTAFTLQKNPARLILSDERGALSVIPIPAPGLLDRIGPGVPQ